MKKIIIAGMVTFAFGGTHVSAATFQFEQAGTRAVLANLEFQPGGTFARSTVTKFEFTDDGIAAFGLGAFGLGDLGTDLRNGFEFGGTITNGESDGGLLSFGATGGPAFLQTSPNLNLGGGNLSDVISLSFGRAGQSDGISTNLRALFGPPGGTSLSGDWEVIPAVTPPTTPVPLPAGMPTLLAGLGCLLIFRNRRMRKAESN